MVTPQMVSPAEVRLYGDDAPPRLAVAVTAIKQQVYAEAFGSPSEARRLGADAVDEHDDALRRLAD